MINAEWENQKRMSCWYYHVEFGPATEIAGIMVLML